MRLSAAAVGGLRRAAHVLVATAIAATGTVAVSAAPAAARHASTAPAAVVRTAVRAAAWTPSWTGTLRPGAHNQHVRAAQLRLAALGYWAGRADGQYGPQTVQAVLALQKTVGLRRTGVLDAAARKVLIAGTRPQARTTTGTTLEIDLRRQLLFVVSRGRTVWAFNTSTGNGELYYSKGSRYVARTPRGRFAIYRQINGRRVAPLGVLDRPKYFYGGYALHGSPSIPGYPASHGCARLSNAAINYLWAADLAPIGRRLWIY